MGRTNWVNNTSHGNGVRLCAETRGRGCKKGSVRSGCQHRRRPGPYPASHQTECTHGRGWRAHVRIPSRTLSILSTKSGRSGLPRACPGHHTGKTAACRKVPTPPRKWLRVVGAGRSRAGTRPICKPGGSVHGERANFTELVLKYIEAKF